MLRSTGSSCSLSSSKGSTSSYEEERRKKKPVLVITGGSGWLGSTIAKLAYEHWSDLKEIRLLDLAPPEKAILSSITGFSPPDSKPKVSYHHGSITEERDLLACFTKADVVIHCAGLVEDGSLLKRRRMKSVNVDGTQRVVQSCLECGVRALVFTGSLTQVLEVDTKKAPFCYDESYQPTGDLAYPHYGGSKTQAERLVLGADGKEGREGIPLRTCSLRCPLMYGEGDQSMVPPIIKTAKHCFGYYPPFGLTGNTGVTMSSLYIGNGAWAHITAARKLLDDMDLEIGGKYFFIGDHTPNFSFSSFAGEFLRPIGYRVLPFGVPFLFVHFMVFILEFFFILLAFLRIDAYTGLTRGTLVFFRISHSVSWERAKREMEYAPLFSHKTALSQSMEYYRTIT